MFVKFFNHFRLTWRLVFDQGVNLWLKLFLVGLPLVYMAVPMPDDLVPLIGFLDDIVFFGLCSLVFNALCPLGLVEKHQRALLGQDGNPFASLDAYRYPTEQRDLAIGFTVAFLILTFGGWLAGLIGAGLFALGFFSSRLMRGQLLSNSVQVSPRQLPDLSKACQSAQSNLPDVRVELFVSQNPVMNAYTFGYSEPYSIILTSGLVERLSPAEIQAVIGHELGHILYGHVRLTSLMSGLGGTVGLLFYRWTRSCEYSADAIALLASGKRLEPVISAFLKLSSGLANTNINLDEFMEQVRADTDKAASFAEMTSTHPFINNRIKNLIRMYQNLGSPNVFAPAL